MIKIVSSLKSGHFLFLKNLSSFQRERGREGGRERERETFINFPALTNAFNFVDSSR